MASVDSNIGLTYPRSNAPNDLYLAMRSLVDQMRRIRVADAATSQQIEDVAAEIGADLQAQIEADELTPSEAYDLMISAISSSIFGPASESVNAAWAEANALAASRLRTALQSYVQQASLTVEQTVRQSETESLASQVTTLIADLGTTSAAITIEATARANGDSANAALVSTVQTQANGNTASISTLQSSVDGIEAQWGVVISLNGQVTGLVRLDSGATGSNFIVVADKFIVAHPSSPTDTITAFVVGLVNGISTVGINGNLLVDGTILARHISAGSVTTAKLAANAVTANEIAANAITAVKIAAGTISADKLVANSITSAQIASETITAAQIASGAITASEVAAGAITADKLSVSSLSAITANIGTLTAGKMQNSAATMIVDLDNKIIKIQT